MAAPLAAGGVACRAAPAGLRRAPAAAAGGLPAGPRSAPALAAAGAGGQLGALAAGCAAAPLLAALGARAQARHRAHGRARGGLARVARGAKAAVRKKSLAEREAESSMLEAALLKLFDETDEPDIFLMRETLTRLAGICPVPNREIVGQWIIYWASRENAVDKVFGTGMTIDAEGVFGFGGLEMKEYLLRFTSKREGKKAVGCEVIRKVGPFPNQSNMMRGVYLTSGTRGLRIQFDDIQTDGNDDVEVNGEKIVSKTADLDVLYSSKSLVALQTEGETEGEYDFFVLTPIEDIRRKQEELLGMDRRRFLFN